MDHSNNILRLSLAVRKWKHIEYPPEHCNLTVRLFSEWLPCSCTSPVFGSDTLAWKPHSLVESSDNKNESTNENDVDYYIATFEASVGAPNMSSSEENLLIFNEKPGIYAVLLNGSAPVGFTYIDCSSFVMNSGSLFTKNTKVLDYDIDFTVKMDQPLLKSDDTIKLEPVTLDIRRYTYC